ncbi:MAG: 2-succinyl-5-enolpyruvyl-6-hydroxy-3-cyclohexene-1-carboxylic-acid synthase [Chromatiaceae bacterium]
MKAQENPDQACANLRWSLALLDGLVGGGMERLVLSPGSRSTPLVLAGQRQPRLEMIPILDERSAAFFALGLARASRRPVGLLCTSGSAPAHWLPAVIEASESEVPLVLLSADRPPELRAWGANQTIDQTRLFGVFVREFHDAGRPDDTPPGRKAMHALGTRAAAVSLGRRRGPVHINLSFPEPLVPGPGCDAEPDAAAPSVSDHLSRLPVSTGRIADICPLVSGRGLILCGPGRYPPKLTDSVWRCAQQLALPVLADPLSGLRFGPASPHCISRYDSVLRNANAARALRPDWVLRFGGTPVSQTLTEWLRGTPSILVDAGGRWRDPTHDARVQIEADPVHFCSWFADAGCISADRAWLDLWRDCEHRLDAVVENHLDGAPWCEAQLIRALIDWLPADSALFSSSSLPIRQLDTWSGTRPTPLGVYGNRGVSGIDGNLSTLAGLNAAGVPTLGLLGDLALFHDLSGLLLTERLKLPFVVVNNGGGRIFDYLPQRELPGLEALWRTPVSVDLGALADPFKLPCRQVVDGRGFEEALQDLASSYATGLIEARIDAGVSRELHLELWRRVRQETIVPI